MPAIFRFNKPFLLLCICSFSLAPVQAWAIAEQLQAMPATMFETGFWALISLTLVFVMLYVFKIVSAMRIAKKREAERLHINEMTSRFDSLPVGVILLSQERTICQVNRTAASLLGQKPELLNGQGVYEALPDVVKTQLESALEADWEQTFVCKLPARDRYYRFKVVPNMPEATGCNGQLIIEDVDHYEHALQDASAMQTHLRALWDQPRLGLIQLRPETKSVVVNKTFSQWINQSPDSINEIESLFPEKYKNAVVQLLQRAEEGHNDSIDVSLNGPEKPIPVTVYAAAVEYTLEQEPLIHLTLINRLSETELANESANHKRHYQSLAAMLPHAVYIVDSDLTLVQYNREFTTVFNVEPGTVKGKKVTELACFNEPVKRLHTQLQGTMLKHEVITIGGSETPAKTLKMSLQPVSTNNERSAIIVVAQDITAQIDLEDERDYARLRLHSFMDQAPLGVVVFDEHDMIKDSNHTATRQLGLAGDELKDKSFYSLFANADEAGRAAKKLQRHDKFTELPAQLKGRLKSVSATLHAGKISEIPQEFACWIGGREEQEFLNNRFEKLIKYASVPVGILEHGHFSHLNSAACAFFGLQDEDELLGKSPDFAQLNGSMTDSQAMSEKLNLARAQGQVLTFNWQHIYQGETLPCELTLVPVHRDGELQSIICIWVDLRAIEQSNAARMEAIRLREAAQREVQEKQHLLANSQSALQRQTATLAEKEESLASTEQRLSRAEEDLSEKIETISDLQQAHKDISEHLNSLQNDYVSNRTLLAESQQINTELEEQLSRSSAKVGSLEQQRSQIADALQYSEKKYRQAQAQLDDSRQETERLTQARKQQNDEVQHYLNQIDGLKSSIDEKDKELASVSSKIQTLQSQLVSSGQTSEKLREQLINQRKASERAEKQRRDIELACQAAEAELAAKGRNIEHLQHEMQMLEKMSQQEKGDMEAYARQLRQELETKQAQLSQTESALDDIRQQADADRREKARQQEALVKLQQEMQLAEDQAMARQAELATLNKQRQEEQSRLQQALNAKHEQLTQTASNLEEARKQNEAAAQEKARQQSIVEKLQADMQQTRDEAQAQQQKLTALNAERKEEHARLQEDLKAKQQQLHEAKEILQDTKQQTETDNAEKVRQQRVFEQLKTELSLMEERSTEQQAAIEQTEKARQAEHEAMEKALSARQKQVDETKAELESRQQQMDLEKRAREEQQLLLEQLHSEMTAMQAQAQSQNEAMKASEKERKDEQQRLTEALENKHALLEDARTELLNRQRQMEEEKLARQEQQAILEQLKSELDDVAQRASKQQEMMNGSDEQWRQHHEEIEAQKKSLQEALHQAQNQNTTMQSQLNQSRDALSQANSKVSQTQSEEQKLQSELDAAREQAQNLTAKLNQQEAQEAELQSQVQMQQSTLTEREKSIDALEQKQQALTDKLAAVEKEYAQTKASMQRQDASQGELSDTLRTLENELNKSKSQLDGKEKALEQAQARLKESESKLAEQEQALVDAQKAELQAGHSGNEPLQQDIRDIPEFAKEPLPGNAQVWFDLLPYLQHNEQVGSLAQSLTGLMDILMATVKDIDEAVAEDRHGKILLNSRNLVKILHTIQSEPLNDMAERLESDLEFNNVDNISIFWPIARQNLMKTLRVIYSHLHQ